MPFRFRRADSSFGTPAASSQLARQLRDHRPFAGSRRPFNRGRYLVNGITSDRWANRVRRDLIVSVNKTLILDVAQTRPDAVAIDQLPDFLGHGNNANTSGCPYCGADNTQWISDSLHPNMAGNIHIAEKWYKAIDAMTGPACRRDAGSD